MGEAKDSQAEAHDLSGRQEADRSGSESKVGEGEARGVVGDIVARRWTPWRTAGSPRCPGDLHFGHNQQMGIRNFYEFRNRNLSLVPRRSLRGTVTGISCGFPAQQARAFPRLCRRAGPLD
jgi:hypothetical protein